MPLPRYNPFRPGSIVTAGMFSGRVTELVSLERALFQTKNENPQHFLIHGERGIGKSSLLFYLQRVACGDIESVTAGSFKFLTVSIELEPTTEYSDIIKSIGAELQRVVGAHQQGKEFAKTAWDFLKRWEVMGVKYREDTTVLEPHQLLDDLTQTFHQTVLAINADCDGILLLIDEADKPPAKSNLGEFVKLFSERLTKRGCNKVSIGLAGLPVVLQKLKESHESSPRIFELLLLEPLLPQERVDVVRKGLAEARAKNSYDIKITPEAEQWISIFSEGYPHFIQQFAHCAFNEDTDNLIDDQDVVTGAFGENGAFQQLGLKYFQELYFEQIGSDEYREVLRAMSEHFDEWLSKEQIRQAVHLKPSTLNNALTALKKRNIIIPKTGTKGMYRLPTKSFAVWIRAYTRGKEGFPLPRSDIQEVFQVGSLQKPTIK